MKELKKLVPALQPLQLSDYSIKQGTRTWNIPPLAESDPALSLKSGTRIVDSRALPDSNPLRPIIETTTHLDGAPTALVYGDSFGDVMSPFFNETFRRTIVVPTAHGPFPTELIQQHRPDIVVLEMVERALSLRPPVSEALESEYLVRSAPSLDQAIARSSGLGGFVDGAKHASGRIEVMGWAIDRAANAPARLVVAYDETRAVGAARMSLKRPDISPSMRDQKAGFRLSIPSKSGLDDLTRLRFFSTTTSGKTYELRSSPTLRQYLKETLAPGG